MYVINVHINKKNRRSDITWYTQNNTRDAYTVICPRLRQLNTSNNNPTFIEIKTVLSPNQSENIKFFH